jgi:putative membrane protein
MKNWFPPYEPHYDVWLIAALWSWAYWVAFVRIAPRLGQPSRPTKAQLTAHIGAILTFLCGSLWPVHDVAEKSMYFVHMAQHLAFINVMALFIVMSVPSWLARWILVRKPILPIVRRATRFIPATILFNFLIVAFHWPAVVTLTIHNGLVHFLAHVLIVTCFVVIWMVIVSPAPEIKRSTPLVQMLFLFLQSVIPTIPAAFLTFGSRPLYKVYVDLPKLFGLSALDDQRIAGLIMKLGSGLLLWGVIAVIFFKWSASEGARELRYRRSRARKIDTAETAD